MPAAAGHSVTVDWLTAGGHSSIRGKCTGVGVCIKVGAVQRGGQRCNGFSRCAGPGTGRLRGGLRSIGFSGRHPGISPSRRGRRSGPPDRARRRLYRRREPGFKSGVLPLDKSPPSRWVQRPRAASVPPSEKIADAGELHSVVPRGRPAYDGRSAPPTSSPWSTTLRRRVGGACVIPV